ncbi:MAG: DUF1565 domain-containing protein, partial [Telluria sp.]
MKKLVNFASDVRVHALLCCSATVLLTACGGGMSDADSAQQNQTAAVSFDSAANQSSAVAAAVPADSETGSGETNVAAAIETGVEQPAAASGADATAAPADDATRLLASSVVVAADATPTIYHLYVATTGSDSNPGTKAQPFKTITRAGALAKPSTTVHVAPGTYNGNVLTKVHGTANARIRYVSDTKWGAKIIGTGTEQMWRN